MKYLLVLLLCCIAGCGSNTCCDHEGMTLVDNNVKIVSVHVFKGVSGNYLSIEFENDYFAMLPYVWGDKMKTGQTGCLYYINSFLEEGSIVYYWQVLR